MLKAKILIIGPSEVMDGVKKWFAEIGGTIALYYWSCIPLDICHEISPWSEKGPVQIIKTATWDRVECGKTALANFLSDTVETVGTDYSPTQGVRILEFESQNLQNGGKDAACEVELWDCAGDFRFEACWPALMKDFNGVVIVFNPDIPSHLKEVETWHSTFISSQGLQAGQCLLIAHHKPGSGVDNSHPQLAPQLNRLPLIHSNLEEDPEEVRQEFRRYLGNVVQSLSESREREEMSIIA